MPGGKTKHDRCVEHVKENSPNVSNPHAVCVASGVRPEKWKKSEDKKNTLVKALADAGQRESALLLKNWGEMDAVAKAMDDKMNKDECHDDDPKHEAKEKAMAEEQKKLAEKLLDLHKE